MTRKSSKTGPKEKESQALQGLLSETAEARLEREIKISRSEADDSSIKAEAGKASGSSGKTPSGSTRPDRSQHSGQGLRKPPSMKETKPQLIERMKKIFLQMDRLEAGLEQKELEREKAEKDKNRLLSELEKLQNEKNEMRKELDAREEFSTAYLDKQKSLEQMIQGLEKEKKELSLEIRKKESMISALEKEKQELEARFLEMEARAGKLSAMEDNFKEALSEKDSRIETLSQEIQKLREDNEKLKKQVDDQQKKAETREKQIEASDWRAKADALWDGSGYTAPQKAINYLSAGLELKPAWPELFNDRGLAYLDDYQLDNALEDFTTAIALKDNFAEAYHNRGMALIKAGKGYAAKKDFQMAARHGLWLGVNALSVPSSRPGVLARIWSLITRKKD
jgi:myosin heavy subunit